MCRLVAILQVVPFYLGLGTESSCSTGHRRGVRLFCVIPARTLPSYVILELREETEHFVEYNSLLPQNCVAGDYYCVDLLEQSAPC